MHILCVIIIIVISSLWHISEALNLFYGITK